MVTGITPFDPPPNSNPLETLALGLGSFFLITTPFNLDFSVVLAEGLVWVGFGFEDEEEEEAIGVELEVDDEVMIDGSRYLACCALTKSIKDE